MSVIESILYGLVSGLTDFLPVSSRAHQSLMLYLFGVDSRVPIQELLVHIGVFCAILVECHDVLVRLRREQKTMSAFHRRRVKSLDSRSYYDLRLLKTASVPLFIGLFLQLATAGLEGRIMYLVAFWLCNAAILLLADHTRRGNRDSRTMSALDGIVMGILGAFSVFPGISRTGMISAYASIRGSDSEHTVNWAVLLGIPATILAVCFDLFYIITAGIGGVTATMIFGYFLSGLAAFGGGYMGITLFRALLNHSGFSKFAYYSIGAALFSFLLYLIT